MISTPFTLISPHLFTEALIYPEAPESVYSTISQIRFHDYSSFSLSNFESFATYHIHQPYPSYPDPVKCKLCFGSYANMLSNSSSFLPLCLYKISDDEPTVSSTHPLRSIYLALCKPSDIVSDETFSVMNDFVDNL